MLGVRFKVFSVIGYKFVRDQHIRLHCSFLPVPHSYIYIFILCLSFVVLFVCSLLICKYRCHNYVWFHMTNEKKMKVYNNIKIWWLAGNFKYTFMFIHCRVNRFGCYFVLSFLFQPWPIILWEEPFSLYSENKFKKRVNGTWCPSFPANLCPASHAYHQNEVITSLRVQVDSAREYRRVIIPIEIQDGPLVEESGKCLFALLD